MAANWSELFNNLVNRMGSLGGGTQQAPTPQQVPQQQAPINSGSLMESIIQALGPNRGETLKNLQGASSPYFMGDPFADAGNVILRGAGIHLAPTYNDLTPIDQLPSVMRAERELQAQNQKLEDVKKAIAGKTSKVEQKSPEAFAKALNDAMDSAITQGKVQFAMKGNDIVPFENKGRGSFSKSTSDSNDMWAKGMLGESQARLAKGISADVFEAVGIPRKTAESIAELTKGQQPSIEGLLKLFLKDGGHDLESFDRMLEAGMKNDMPPQPGMEALFTGRFANSPSSEIQSALLQFLKSQAPKK